MMILAMTIMVAHYYHLLLLPVQQSAIMEKEEQPTRQQVIHSISLKIGLVTIAPSLYRGDKLDAGNATSGEVARGKVGGHSRQRARVVDKRRRRMVLIEQWIGRVVRLYCRRGKRGVGSVTSGEGERWSLRAIMVAVVRRR